MGCNRLPTNVLEMKGAFIKHPERQREDPKVEIGLGPPPDYFEEIEKAIWEEIKNSAPEGVLAKSDRMIVEMAVPLIQRQRAREKMKAAEMTFLLSVFSRLGCTPADRSRVAAPKKDQGELFDAFDEIA